MLYLLVVVFEIAGNYSLRIARRGIHLSSAYLGNNKKEKASLQLYCTINLVEFKVQQISASDTSWRFSDPWGS